MSLHCPNCDSTKVSTRLTAMRISAFIGMLGGALRGTGTILLTGPAVSGIGLAKPNNINLNAISSAILTGLAGAVGGCAMGAQLGEKLDRHVLAHNHCLSCGHRFNQPA